MAPDETAPRLQLPTWLVNLITCLGTVAALVTTVGGPVMSLTVFEPLARVERRQDKSEATVERLAEITAQDLTKIKSDLALLTQGQADNRDFQQFVRRFILDQQRR